MSAVRPRVFVSSVIAGFEEYREAAAAGIVDAGCEPVMVEQFPSLNSSPRVACLDAIANCDAVVVIVGDRPGFKAPSGKYVVEEEWQFARKRATPLFAFVQVGHKEPDAARIANEISEFVHGRFRRTFSDPSELRTHVASTLNDMTSNTRANVDPSRLLTALSARHQGGYETHVRLVIQPVRVTELVDPLELDSRTFQNALFQLGMDGSAPLFSIRAKKSAAVGTSQLQLDQPDESGRDPEQWRATATISVDGFLVAERNASLPTARSGWGDSSNLDLALKLSDLEQATTSLFQFAAAFYNRVDPYIACRDFVYGIALVNLGMRYIYDAIPAAGQGVPVRMSDNNNILAFDSPRRIVREALDQPREEIARAVGLLRRRAQPGV